MWLHHGLQLSRHQLQTAKDFFFNFQSGVQDVVHDGDDSDVVILNGEVCCLGQIHSGASEFDFDNLRREFGNWQCTFY